ncbi:protein D2-like [Mytilus edulis]|uniref:protein D2-like n=1 Tax=Mytilus edulis TaxID=6550 RepID=UPI0039EE4D9F
MSQVQIYKCTEINSIMLLLYCISISLVHTILGFCTPDLPEPDPLCGETSLGMKPDDVYGTCNNEEGKLQGIREIQKWKVTDRPQVKFQNAKKDQLYILIMRDPDAGSARDVLHWLVTDITGSSLEAGKIDGTEQMKYNGPNPPGEQHHRYQFFLYEQKRSNVDLSLVKRIHFKLVPFLERNELCPNDVVASFQYKSFS